MLRVKSFGIMDDKGMNELLDNYKLADGMHILVSDGQVCIPYEDGQPIPNAVTVCSLGGDKNTILRQMDIIKQSQGVMQGIIADAKEKEQTAEIAHKAKTNDKPLEKRYLEAKAARQQAEAQLEQNAAELVRLRMNVDNLDAQIAMLKNQ